MADSICQPGNRQGSGPASALLPDLSACDQEQVQFIGAIQPHGLLLVLNESDLTISHASANVAALLLPPGAAQDITRTRLANLLAPDTSASLTARLREADLDCVPAHLGSLTANGHDFELFAHRINGQIILEGERIDAAHQRSAPLYAEVRSCIAGLQTAATVEECLSVAVQHLRKLTGYDRVLAYKFLGDGTGHILAEAKRDDISSFLGLHFPPGDVPAPARRVLSLVWIRHQPDIAYTAVPIQAVQAGTAAAPLDLSYSLLRSTSEMCNRYYLNLGIHAKLIVALLDHGEMWGAVICQHQTPKFVPYETRLACETIAHSVSLAITDKDRALHAQDGAHLREKTEQLIDRLATAPSWVVPLAANNTLLNLLPAGGAAIVPADSSGTIVRQGDTPGDAAIRDLVSWLEQRNPDEIDSLYATYSLPSRFAEAVEYCASASGLLAARLSPGEYLLWFRPETAYEVSWAGDPQKPVEVDEKSGRLRLAPRRSFTMQRALLQGLAAPWQNYELEAVVALRRAIGITRRAETLAAKVDQLAASNTELQTFAYTASHDLREPLRGIQTYSQLVARDLRNVYGGNENARLQTIDRLARRMDELLQSLLYYSRLDSVEPRREPVDLNDLLAQVLETMTNTLQSSGAQIRVLQPLPTLVCDPVQIRQVLTNLIVNGIKYNASPEKIIEVGYTGGPPPTLSVRDNGIGIASEHHQTVFGIFKRLNNREQFGEGTGAGLAIVRKMVEHHGGKVWVESAPGAGATFCFTLPQPASAQTGSQAAAN